MIKIVPPPMYIEVSFAFFTLSEDAKKHIGAH